MNIKCMLACMASGNTEAAATTAAPLEKSINSFSCMWRCSHHRSTHTHTPLPAFRSFHCVFHFIRHTHISLCHIQLVFKQKLLLLVCVFFFIKLRNCLTLMQHESTSPQTKCHKIQEYSNFLACTGCCYFLYCLCCHYSAFTCCCLRIERKSEFWSIFGRFFFSHLLLVIFCFYSIFIAIFEYNFNWFLNNYKYSTGFAAMTHEAQSEQQKRRDAYEAVWSVHRERNVFIKAHRKRENYTQIIMWRRVRCIKGIGWIKSIRKMHNIYTINK